MITKEMKETEKVYTAPEIAKKLGVKKTTLYHYNQLGMIKLKTGDQGQLMGTQTEIDQIKKQMERPEGSMNVHEFAEKNHLTPSVIYQKIRSLKIKPIKEKVLFDKKTYYWISDLKKINELNLKKRSQVKYLPDKDLVPNTDKMFDKNQDYTLYTLGRFIDPESPAYFTNIISWVRNNRVDFSVDTNGKIFFTPQQSEKIKHDYKNIGDKEMYSNKRTAEMIGINPVEMIRLRQETGINPTRILGIRGSFFDQHEVKTLMNYHNRKKSAGKKGI